MKKIILSIAVLALALSSCEDLSGSHLVVWSIVPVDIRRDVRQRYGRPGQYRTYASGTGLELYFDQNDGSLVERI